MKYQINLNTYCYSWVLTVVLYYFGRTDRNISFDEPASDTNPSVIIPHSHCKGGAKGGGGSKKSDDDGGDGWADVFWDCL